MTNPLIPDKGHVVDPLLAWSDHTVAGTMPRVARVVAPVRIQLSRRKGWRMPPNTVRVARPGRWGNPYRVETFGLALAMTLFMDTARGAWSPSNVEHLNDELAGRAYAAHCEFGRRFSVLASEAIRAELRGQNVACWCPLDQACHGDVLLEIANR